MKILVTGGAGFIGSFLCRELIRRGDDVTTIDNFSDYYSKRAKLFNLELTKYLSQQRISKQTRKKIIEIHEKLEFYKNKALTSSKMGSFKFKEIDIRDKKKLDLLFKTGGFDKIIHLAAMAGVPQSLKQPHLYTEVNVDGTVNILELASKYHIKKLVFASSSSIYGNKNRTPFNEEQVIDNPISLYGATKRMGEIACYTYHYLFKLPIVITRIFGPVYGPLQRPYGMAAQKFIRQADKGLPITIYGDGSMKRDCTYIDDEITGLIAALDAKIDFEIINIGSGKPISVKNMAKFTLKYFGKGKIIYLNLPPTEVPITYADITKAKKLLNFEAKISYREGIKRQIEIYKLMPTWYKNLKI